MKYTKQVITEEALKYTTRSDFQRESLGAYQAAKRNDLLNEVCSHMILKRNNHWDKKTVHKEALKYSRRVDFQNGAKGAYIWALRRKIMDDVCSHMENKIRKTIPFDLCKETALKYKTRVSFQKNDASIYMKALKKKWLDNICSHMENGLITYTESEIITRARKYKSRSEFEENDPRGYDLVRHRGLKEIAYAHMGELKRGFDSCKAATLYYLSVNNGQAYKIGITNATVQKRYGKQKSSDLDNIRIIKEWNYPVGEDALKLEREILREFKYAKYEGKDLLTNGNTELFDRDVLGLDV